MNINTINYGSISAGPGDRIEIFTQGCFNACPGCFSPETWDPNLGTNMTVSEIMSLFPSAIANGYEPYLTICGGEPTLYLEEVIDLCRKFKNQFDDRAHIILYTGLSLPHAESLPGFSELRDYIDGLVAGPFNKDEACLFNPRDFIGSSNQMYYFTQGCVHFAFSAAMANEGANNPKYWKNLGLPG